MLKKKESGKKEREANVIKTGYPAYTTSQVLFHFCA